VISWGHNDYGQSDDPEPLLDPEVRPTSFIQVISWGWNIDGQSNDQQAAFLIPSSGKLIKPARKR
jgi:hypothetical protein